MSCNVFARTQGLSRIAALTAITLVIAGCSALDEDETATRVAGPETTAENAPSVLDEILLQRLELAAPFGDPAFFVLPESDDFSAIPQDPQNPLTPEKVRLGQLLYHETCLGVDNLREEGFETYSCSSCHFAQAGFQANRAQGVAEGGLGFGLNGEGREFDPDYLPGPEFPDVQPIRSPSSMNAAYQELMLWNGQFGGVGDNLGTEDLWLPGTPLESNRLGLHGLETQAHAGLAVHRMGSVDLSRIEEIDTYQALFSDAFPGEDEPLNRLNAALAIAAYERTLLANRAPFQRWLRGERRAMTPREKRGAILFFGEAGCAACHTGPALSSMTFYALGMNDLDGTYDPARVFLGASGGTVPEATRKGRGGFTGRDEDLYTFKTPQLYNLADSPFYGHGASFASLEEVVLYKNGAVPENPLVPSDRLAPQFVPLGLAEPEVNDLVAFLELSLRDPQLARYLPDELPSGNCFPNNDPESRHDLGCDPLPVTSPTPPRHHDVADGGVR